MTALHAHLQGAAPAPAFLGSPARRELLVRGLQLTGAVAAAAPAAVAEEAPALRTPVIESFPNFGSLVPLYGVFALAGSAANAASDEGRLAAVRARFGRLSDQDLDAVRFLCVQYIGAIKYIDPDEKLVAFDKAGRFKACDEALRAYQ